MFFDNINIFLSFFIVFLLGIIIGAKLTTEWG